MTTKQDLSNTFLADAITWANETRGNKQALADLMTARYGKVSRQQISLWLHESPEHRQEPVLGNALAMRECIAELKAQTNTTAAT